MKASLVFTLMVLLPMTNAALAQTPLKEGKITDLNIVPTFASPASPGTLQWVYVYDKNPGVKYLRLYFSSVNDDTNEDYTIFIKDRRGKVVESYQKRRLASLNAFWTRIVTGDVARVEVVGARPPLGLSFKLAAVAMHSNSGSTDSIFYPDDREKLRDYTNREPRDYFAPLLAAARAVAKISFVEAGLLKSCTGFLISEQELLTNYHCVRTTDMCKTAVAIFGYEYVGRDLNEGEQFNCVGIVEGKTKKDLDLAVLRLESNPGATWGHLRFSNRSPNQGEYLFMIHHPAGEDKQITRVDCNVLVAVADGYTPQTDFGHRCDTLEGSSGSPILDKDFKVLGVHHLGFDGIDPNWKDRSRAIRADKIFGFIGGP
jgi:V8-like Glu-specific endopeptidase